MENILLKYMSNRMEQKQPVKEYGPVITISREYGCWGCQIAVILTELLNQKMTAKGKTPLWKCISKEVLEKAANELNQKPDNISHIFGAEEKGLLGDIIVSFGSKEYTSDSKIKKTITKIVRNYSEDGHVIIVGRAGCIITKDIPNSFHVKLIAPLDYRIKRIVERFNLNEAAAKAKVLDMDQKRAAFMGFYKGNKPDSEIFDAIYNRMTLTENEIAESVIKVIETRSNYI
jgi:cytidylate kinase